MMNYLFADKAGLNYLCVGPGGLSWVPKDDAVAVERDAFTVAGADNAKSFAAWIMNEYDCHTNIWAVDDLPRDSEIREECVDAFAVWLLKSGHAISTEQADRIAWDFVAAAWDGDNDIENWKASFVESLTI